MAIGDTDISIVNSALGLLGAEEIESFTERSNEARVAKRYYTGCRREVLERFDWDFARARQPLTLHGDGGIDGYYAYRYALPSDYITMRRIENPLGPSAPPVPYMLLRSADRTETTVLTNAQDAVGIYTFDCKDTSAFSPSFVPVLEYCLAWRMAMPITKKASKATEMGQIYTAMFRQGSANNANASQAEPPRPAPWIGRR